MEKHQTLINSNKNQINGQNSNQSHNQITNLNQNQRICQNLNQINQNHKKNINPNCSPNLNQHQNKNNSFNDSHNHIHDHSHINQNPITFIEDEKMEEENEISNGNNNNLLQEKILVDKQLLKLKINEEYTNDMLGRALSKAEYYSSRYGKKNIDNKKFNYYNRFDNGFNKEKQNLLKSLINALDTLQDYYEMDGKNKRFPSNFGEKDIINYIIKLRDNCKDNDENKNIFNEFIEVIQGKKVNFGKYIISENASVNPNILVTSGISSMKYVSRQEKEWKKKAMKNGDYPVPLKVGMDWTSNNHIPDDLKYFDNEI